MRKKIFMQNLDDKKIFIFMISCVILVFYFLLWQNGKLKKSLKYSSVVENVCIFNNGGLITSSKERYSKTHAQKLNGNKFKITIICKDK